MSLTALPRLLLDAVAPLRCAGCGAWDDHLCFVCAGRLMDRPVPSIEEGVRAAFEYSDPVDRIIHAGKYGDGRTALRRLAELAATRLRLTARDVLVPVPLGRRRARARGYNQAALIARVWGESMGAAVIEDLLVRSRETRPQVGRSRQGRLHNIADAFATRGQVPRGGLTLVDDVQTTGATLMAAAHALRSAGVEDVRAAVLARPV